MSPAPAGESFEEIDPFDLPEWLGDREVTWRPECGIRVGHHVGGRLAGAPDLELACDLLAVDEAYPTPVAGTGLRTRSHQAWRHGEVLLVRQADRLTLAVPGRDFTADRVLDAVGRLARAVGADAESFGVLLRLGARPGEPAEGGPAR